MVYLAMSGKLRIADVLAQAVKAAKYYEKSPNAPTLLSKYVPSIENSFSPARSDSEHFSSVLSV